MGGRGGGDGGEWGGRPEPVMGCNLFDPAT